MRPLISICMPTFNGADSLPKALESIVPFLSKNVTLTVVDDASTDQSAKILRNYSLGHSNIFFYRNNQNLGMDRNFLRVVELAKAEYVWFCGQDDLLGGIAINEVERILSCNDVIALNCNFSQYNWNYSKINFESFFDLSTFDCYKKLKHSSLLVFDSAEEYFNVFTQPPSFLPSVVLKRELFFQTRCEKYFDTYFLQVGVFLEHIHRGRTAALTPPLIKGRVPREGWQSDGSKLLKIMTGDLRAKLTAFAANPKLPKRIIIRDQIKFFLNYIFLLSASYRLGLDFEELKSNKSYSIRPLNRFLRFYIATCQKLPPRAVSLAVTILQPLKYFLLRFHSLKQLRG